MNQEKYELFLKETNHTEKSINSRISRLKKVEKLFQINIDTIIDDKNKIHEILDELKTKNLDTSNQNLSNALHTYYQCVTGNNFE